jgi:hypothetical protein
VYNGPNVGPEKEEVVMYRTLSRTLLMVLGVALAAWSGSAGLTAGRQALASADAKGWIGDWTLTIEGGRGPQERSLTIKDLSGKVAATMGGGRGGPIEIADVSKKGDDLVLKFMQRGRGGEVDVVMTIAMQADGTLKVSQEIGGNTQSGTGKKKT